MSNQELIDFLLGELPQERADAMRERLGRDAELAREAAVYADALGVLREAASDAAWAPSGSNVLRFAARFSLVAAALILVAVGVFWMQRGNGAEHRVFEPTTAFGALFPEELGADGSIHPQLGAHAYRVERGGASVAAIGARDSHPIGVGDTVLEESELSCGADSGACISLPHGGLLFLRPLSTVQLRSRPDGRVALRLLTGVAATVVGNEPLHLAVEGTDLLLSQLSGAALLRHQESDVVCLRGQLELHVEDGAHWPVPRGERLPAACARRPESSAYRIERLDLDWYETLIGRRARHESVDLDESGRSGPLRVADGTLLYVRAESRESGEITISFGDGQSRSFPIVGGKPLEIRVRLRGLGAGPRLRVEPAAAIKQIRLFEPR